MNKIQGIYAASITVFNQDLSLNAKKTISHADFLIDNGCHGVVLLGSTGQSQLISISEKIKLLNSIPQSKNFDKAHNLLNKAIQIKPFFLEAHNNLGLLHMQSYLQ